MLRVWMILGLAAMLTACTITIGKKNHPISVTRLQNNAPDAARGMREPVVPEMLVPCRGHVLVPALGMTLVLHGSAPPANGEYLREERITPPYRIISPGARLTPDENPQRLNVEVDKSNRIIGLYCG
jgi:hypothetical protein